MREKTANDGFVKGRYAVMACIAAAGVSFAAQATDMEHKAKTLATVATAHSGVAEILCDDAQGWKFEASAADDNGRDVVTVKISSPTTKRPPKFGVYFRVNGDGVQNVWSTHFTLDGYHLRPKLWWGGPSRLKSMLASNSPLAVGFNSTGVSRAAVACSEAFEAVEFGLYADDETCDIIGRCEFFTQPTSDRSEYKVRVMFDRRGVEWYRAVREASDWIVAENGFKSANVPEAAYDPLYSTWYAYLQDVHAGELEKEARLAASVGMKTMILDDGWQKVESRTFYSATGDWMPVPSRFPDMKAHVDAVHKAGLKYMLWLAVPFMGDEAKNYPRFKDKMLKGGDTGILDPRFPEVREYLISTYERVIRDWGFDGVKLDFIDSFVLPEKDPAVEQNYAGRDYKSLPEAVDRLMKDVVLRLRKINPDVLIEFRQGYMGPAIRQYGNMMRAADCPADPCANRKRIADLRLTSGETAVHSDMLVWSRDESPEGAALPILNAIFGTIQYSMILEKLSEPHRDVIRSWLEFSQEHRDTLLKGDFRPHHPENGYTWIEAENAAELIAVVYSSDTCAAVKSKGKPVYLVNATGAGAMLVDLPEKPARVDLFDVFGNPVGSVPGAAGLQRLTVPVSGYAKIVPVGPRKTVAFLGGSITQMFGFRPRVMRMLRTRYPRVDFIEIDAGLSSTCSDTGAFRMREDVLAKGMPDLFICESAVNDDQDGHFDRRHCLRGVEGCVRQMRKANPSCAIVVGLMVNKDQFDGLSSGKTPIPYAVGREVAEHYGAALADVGTALVESSRDGGIGWAEYRDCHPSPAGCDLGAKVVMDAIGRVFDPLKPTSSKPMPEPIDAACYDVAAVIPFSDVRMGPGWHVSRPDWSGIKGSKRPYFTRGDALWSETPGSEASFTFNGRAVAAILTSASCDSGDLEVSIDGGDWSLVKLRAYPDLHYPYTQMFADDLAPARHTVRLRVAAAVRDGVKCSAVRIHRLVFNGL